MSLKRTLIFAFLILSYAFSQDSDFELKFATLAPQSSSWGEALSKMRKDVFIKTNKRVKIKIYWSGQMGDEAEMYNKIKVGQLDGFAVTGNGLGIVMIESRLLELPFLYKNSQQVDKVYKAVTPLLRTFFREKGFELISLSETGNSYFFSKEDIKNFNDVSNSKMWLWRGDDFAKVVFQQMKISATPVSFIDVIPSLQTGLINGFYATPTAAIALQWNANVKYMLNNPIVDVSGGIFFSSKAWDKISAADKAIVYAVTEEAIAILTKLNRENDAKSLTVFKESGIILNDYSGEAPNVPQLQQSIIANLKTISGVNAKHIDDLYKLIQSNL